MPLITHSRYIRKGNNILRISVLSILLAVFCALACAADPIPAIARRVQGVDASVGVAILYGDSSYTLHNDTAYPLMSTFKVHVAAAALACMQAEGIAPDSLVTLTPDHLHPNTYSPLRDRFPDQDVTLSLRELIDYTVSHSDNNTCDYLIAFAGGIRAVDAWVQSLGISDTRLTATEDDMHRDLLRSYDNHSTPLAMAQFLQRLYTANILTTSYFHVLESALLGCTTGVDKLPAGLPAGLPIAHKTGHSDRLPAPSQDVPGLLIATTDAGVLYLPDGEKCYIVVLIRDSRLSDSANAALIADIARLAYQHLF